MDLDTITFVLRNGVMTKLPFAYVGDAPNARILGISTDGTQIYGVLNENQVGQAQPPLSVLENGGIRPGVLGPVVPFANGLQARRNPVGGWIGESLRSGEKVSAVSQDFSTFVGTVGSRAAIWTQGTTTIVPTIS